MNGSADPFNDDVLRALISRLSPADRQTMLGLCGASHAVWDPFQTLLRHAIRDDSDHFLREAQRHSSAPLPRHSLSR